MNVHEFELVFVTLFANLGLNSSNSWLIALKSPTGSSLSPRTTCISTLYMIA